MHVEDKDMQCDAPHVYSDSDAVIAEHHNAVTISTRGLQGPTVKIQHIYVIILTQDSYIIV